MRLERQEPSPVNPRSKEQLPQIDWADHWPYGVTPILAAAVLESWWKTEHPETIAALAANNLHAPGTWIRVQAIPPNSRQPWRMKYSCPDPTDAYLANLESLDEMEVDEYE